MPAPLLSIETTATLPPAADVVVIGGGIVGACTAYYLARRGVKVALVEKGRIGAEQSSRNWGWCRQQNRDARELPMATASLALWDAMAGEIGESVGFRRTGLLYLSNDEAEIAGWARWRDFARTQGVVTNMLSSAEATERGSRDRPALEGRRLLPHRRHRRSRARRPGHRPRCDAFRCQRASVLRRPRPRARGRPGRRRGHRSGNDPHPQRSARRRGLGLLLLPPARHPLPPGRGALLDPRRRPGRRRARRAPHLAGLADTARERRLHPRGLRQRAGRSDAAADPLRPVLPADVRPALPRARPGRAPGLARRPRDLRPLGARPSDADGAHPHPRSPARCRDDPRDPRPGARASSRPRSAFRSPPNGRATSTRPRTGCRRSARPRSPA